jgi:DNA-directed RNA polymerase subunit RPC12/RpoP
MAKPSFCRELSFMEFIKRNGYYECPKCEARLKLEMDPLLILACEILADKCPHCNTYIVINKMDVLTVKIEGFTNFEQSEARLSELGPTIKWKY